MPCKRGADIYKVCSDRAVRFVLEFLIDRQPKAAAIRAGYSEKSASRTALKILSRPQVQAYIGKIDREDVEKLEVDRQEVLLQLVNALTWKARDLVNEDGFLLPPQELPERAQCQVDGVKQKILRRITQEDGTIEEIIEMEYKMTPRAAAREQAMKHKGLFEADKLDINVGADFLAELAKPVPPNSVEARLDQERKLLENKDASGD